MRSVKDTQSTTVVRMLAMAKKVEMIAIPMTWKAKVEKNCGSARPSTASPV